MNDKNTFNIMTLQKNIEESLKKPDAKQSCLGFEYKLLLLYSSQFGLYVLPQLNTINIWHGIMFVRYGIFKEGKFKFKITFDNFPQKPPRAYFVSEVYHPMVDQQTGQIDLGPQLTNQWNYGTQHLVFSVIDHIRMVINDVKKYDVQDSFNSKAGQLYRNNVEQFFIKVRQCVEQSKNQLYTNYAQTSLKFVPYNSKHQKLRDGLSMICEDHSLSTEDKKKKFLQMLKE